MFSTLMTFSIIANAFYISSFFSSNRDLKISYFTKLLNYPTSYYTDTVYIKHFTIDLVLVGLVSVLESVCCMCCNLVTMAKY